MKQNVAAQGTPKRSLKARAWRQRYLFLMVLPGFLIVLVFSYFPMYGILIAFENYSVNKGVMGSEWVGFKHFMDFFTNPMAFRVVKNTLILGVYNLLWSFPIPIVLAVLFNEIKNQKFKKLVQTVSYFPYFLSTVIVAGMLLSFCSREGLFNQIRALIGLEPLLFLQDPGSFRTLFIGSGIWQGAGYGTILYLAAISNIDPSLYDVASIDGASRFQKIRHITLPALRPTITIMLIMAVGGILGSDFQKIMLLYTPQTYPVADVIGTYTYREGIAGARFEYTTAIGLFNSLISFVLLAIANLISRKASDTSLW
ncbi:MAG: sugar ABC transporter permease [Lachnospiraceae bacterium]|nr:ABC transporter permease subunit [uncultured Acetatifactor sp.]MCI9218607.1 sugar ABC transporter permease [Lachnospiraceae bacterium]